MLYLLADLQVVVTVVDEGLKVLLHAQGDQPVVHNVAVLHHGGRNLSSGKKTGDENEKYSCIVYFYNVDTAGGGAGSVLPALGIFTAYLS